MIKNHSLSDIEIIIKGVKILQKSLGTSATWRFLSLLLRLYFSLFYGF